MSWGRCGAGFDCRRWWKTAGMKARRVGVDARCWPAVAVHGGGARAGGGGARRRHTVGRDGIGR